MISFNKVFYLFHIHFSVHLVHLVRVCKTVENSEKTIPDARHFYDIFRKGHSSVAGRRTDNPLTQLAAHSSQRAGHKN